MKNNHFIFVHDGCTTADLQSHIQVYADARVVCLDFWKEQELKGQGIPYISQQEFLTDSGTSHEWYARAQTIAREWYRLPDMNFFSYQGIQIGEVLEPILEAHLSRLFYYVRIYLAFKNAYPNAVVHIPAPIVEEAPAAAGLVTFERWAVIDAARMVGLATDGFAERVAPPAAHLFPRTIWKTLAVHAYNFLIGFAPRRPLKIFASEYWSHIGPIIEQMDDVELVLMEFSELKHIAKKHIWNHRIRIRHPADATTRRIRRNAFARGEEMMLQWRAIQTVVSSYFSSYSADLDWFPVQEACEYLVTYAPRVIADIDALHWVVQEESPNLIVQLASVGGRRHHFFLMTRVAKILGVPTLELQHAGAVFDPRSIHSRLETSYLASYGEVERREHIRNGYAAERIIPIGSPRFDSYGKRVPQLAQKREQTLRSIGLDPARPVIFVTVPEERTDLYPLHFSSYEIANAFRDLQHVQAVLPDTQFIIKFRRRHFDDRHRNYIATLFPEGSVAIVDSDPLPLICASDCVLSGNSTILYEAMISMRPVILYPWKASDLNLPVYQSVAPYAASGKELAAIVKKVCTNDTYRHDVNNREQAFIAGHLFDGHSVERIAALFRTLQVKHQTTN